MTEPDRYSLASYYSKESLAGAHFSGSEKEGPAAKESETSIEDTTFEPYAIQQNILYNKNEPPDDIKFTIKDSEDTQEDFQSDSY